VVLQSFALRLKSAVKSLSEKLGKTYRFILGRMGGEEFLLLAFGPFSRESLITMGDHFCETVRIRPVPDDNEWAQLADIRPKTVVLPPSRERALTVSIGISSASPPQIARIEQMKREADVALYRAKASGRNQSCFFPEILSALLTSSWV
jgi:diguanylate cyclase (GGDEF)-like protein